MIWPLPRRLDLGIEDVIADLFHLKCTVGGSAKPKIVWYGMKNFKVKDRVKFRNERRAEYDVAQRASHRRRIVYVHDPWVE